MGSSLRSEAEPSTPGIPSASRRHLLECLEAGDLLVVIIDAAGRVTWCNGAFRKAILDGQADWDGSFRSLLSEEGLRLLPHVLPAEAGGVTTGDLGHKLPAGQATIAYQFLAGQDGTVIAIGRDRTAERELIDQLEASNEDLHREMGRRSELAEKLKELARTDFLTDLANRRQFDEVLDREWRRMKRYQAHFTLILVDLDFFKDINDRMGHQVGDEVLQTVARALRSEVRAEDLVARYGGDEFAIIALGTDPSRGRDLAERLRKRVDAMQMPAGSRVTLSIGVASTNGGSAPAEVSDLISRADRALYRAKEGGRNRVEVD